MGKMCTYIDHCNLRELSQGHIHLNSLGHFEILFYGKGEDSGNFAYQRGIPSLIHYRACLGLFFGNSQWQLRLPDIE